MHTSNNKLRTMHMRLPGYGYAEDTLRKKKKLLTAVQNNTVRTNWIKAKFDNTQQNRKCRFYGDKEETANYRINECIKLAQKKYKTSHDWVGKVIHLKLCKRLKFDDTNKWYGPKPQFVLKMRCIRLSRIFRSKRIAKSQPDDQTEDQF